MISAARLACAALLAFVLASPAAAADQAPGDALAKAALATCEGSDIGLAATEARAVAAGWPAFTDAKARKGVPATRVSEWKVTNAKGKIDALAILTLADRAAIETAPGQKALVCFVLLPLTSVGPLMADLAGQYHAPRDPVLFLKRDAAGVRPLGLVEMLDEVPVMVSKLQPGERLIIVTAERARSKLGSIIITVFEQPAEPRP